MSTAMREVRRDGQVAVLATCSTDGQASLAEKVGNSRPGDPPQGRRSRISRSVGGNRGETLSSPPLSLTPFRVCRGPADDHIVVALKRGLLNRSGLGSRRRGGRRPNPGR